MNPLEPRVLLVIVVLWIVILVGVAVVVRQLLSQLKRANEQITRLHDALRLRQLWAQARRYEVAALLLISNKRHAGKLLDSFLLLKLSGELERQARGIGLETNGRARPGFPRPEPLAPAEFSELAALSGLQI